MEASYGDRLIMGTKVCLFTPLPPVTLEELVPADHFYRHLDRVLEVAFVRELVQDCYAAGLGRPSVDPQVFFRLQLVMFVEGIRSERQLLRLAANLLSVRWFQGYSRDEPLPDRGRNARWLAGSAMVGGWCSRQSAAWWSVRARSMSLPLASF